MTKVRQAEKLLERNEQPPRSRSSPGSCGSRSQAGRGSATSSPGSTARSPSAAASGSARSTSTSLRGERVAVTGRNGSGKTTLLALLLGELPLGTRARGRSAARRCSARSTRRRAATPATSRCSTPSSRAPASPRSTRARCSRSSASAPTHVLRAGATLSPGERTRARLAELQARGVNCLVLDEPTNHLDLEAVEELEEALRRYDGTLVVVSHDRRFLERVAPTGSCARSASRLDSRSRSWQSRRRKTSKARRDKRRAQHGIEAPRVNVCPTVRLAEAAAPRLPDVQDVRGREIEPLRTPAP